MKIIIRLKALKRTIFLGPKERKLYSLNTDEKGSVLDAFHPARWNRSKCIDFVLRRVGYIYMRDEGGESLQLTFWIEILRPTKIRQSILNIQ